MIGNWQGGRKECVDVSGDIGDENIVSGNKQDTRVHAGQVMPCGKSVQCAVDGEEIGIMRHEHLAASRCRMDMEIIWHFGETEIATIRGRVIRSNKLSHQDTGTDVLIKVEVRHQIAAANRFAMRRSSMISL